VVTSPFSVRTRSGCIWHAATPSFASERHPTNCAQKAIFFHKLLTALQGSSSDQNHASIVDIPRSVPANISSRRSRKSFRDYRRMFLLLCGLNPMRQRSNQFCATIDWSWNKSSALEAYSMFSLQLWGRNGGRVSFPLRGPARRHSHPGRRSLLITVFQSLPMSTVRPMVRFHPHCLPSISDRSNTRRRTTLSTWDTKQRVPTPFQHSP
jgi:hypothetical protein